MKFRIVTDIIVEFNKEIVFCTIIYKNHFSVRCYGYKYQKFFQKYQIIFEPHLSVTCKTSRARGIICLIRYSCYQMDTGKIDVIEN